MASSTKKATSTPATVAVAVATALTLTMGVGAKEHTFTVPLADIGLDAKAVTPATFYLLHNGFSQSMRDSIAGYAKELKAEGLTDSKGNVIPDGTRTYSDAEVDEMVLAALNERFDAIKAGTVAMGGGPRLRGIDALMRDVAVERLNGVYAENKTATKPKGEKWTALVKAYMAKNDADLRVEAQRRQDAAKAEGTKGADDVLALLADIEKAEKAAA